ncbi:MAG: sulfotransferase family 2 domain-containing protein [Cyclobacteriaceae bacterium]
MLVSHDYKFIYIKPKKVAGSSIQAYLARYCENGINFHRDPKSHMKAEDVKALVGDEVWNSYLKITSVRNPWDKTVSLYFWRKRKRPLYVHIRRILRGWPWHGPAHRYNFKDFVKAMFENDTLNEDKAITNIDGRLPDYYFIRYESMHQDLEKLCERLGVTYNPDDMPQKKVGHRKSRSYEEHFDEESKEFVARAYQEEIERFGYTY